LGEISGSIVEALPMTKPSGIHLMAIHCAAAERGVLIKKRKERKFISKA